MGSAISTHTRRYNPMRMNFGSWCPSSCSLRLWRGEFYKLRFRDVGCEFRDPTTSSMKHQLDQQKLAAELKDVLVSGKWAPTGARKSMRNGRQGPTSLTVGSFPREMTFVKSWGGIVQCHIEQEVAKGTSHIQIERRGDIIQSHLLIRDLMGFTGSRTLWTLLYRVPENRQESLTHITEKNRNEHDTPEKPTKNIMSSTKILLKALNTLKLNLLL